MGGNVGPLRFGLVGTVTVGSDEVLAISAPCALVEGECYHK